MAGGWSLQRAETQRLFYLAVITLVSFSHCVQYKNFSGDVPSQAFASGVAEATPALTARTRETAEGVAEPIYFKTTGDTETSVTRTRQLTRTMFTPDPTATVQDGVYFPVEQTSSVARTAGRDSPVSSSQESVTSEQSANIHEDIFQSTVVSVLTSPDIARNRTGDDSESEVKTFYVYVDQCKKDEIIRFLATRGEISGFHGQWTRLGAILICSWEITVPEGFFIAATCEMDFEACRDKSGARILASETPAVVLGRQVWSSTEYAKYRCHTNNRVVFTQSNRLFIAISDTQITAAGRLLKFRIKFHSTQEKWLYKLNVVFTSSISGSITSPGYDGLNGYARFMNATYKLDVPEGNVVMLSFRRFELQQSGKYGAPNRDVWCEDYLELLRVNSSGDEVPVWKLCGVQVLDSEVYSSSLVFRLFTKYEGVVGVTGIKALFSFHNQSKPPVKLDNGLFNCSVPYYASFQHHLDCNMEQECLDGDDEAEHCPFSSPACNGFIAVRNQPYCFTYHSYDIRGPDAFSKSRTWSASKEYCLDQGGQLVMLRTQEDMVAFEDIYKFAKRRQDVFIGMQMSPSTMPFVYMKTYMWNDGSIAYRTNVFVHAWTDKYKCFSYESRSHLIKPVTCNRQSALGYVCQHTVAAVKPTKQPMLQFPRPQVSQESISKLNQTLVFCPDRHFTFDFLRCDVKSQCVNTTQPLCSFPNPDELVALSVEESSYADSTHGHTGAVSMFVCDDGKATLPYTLVCDFRQDCADKSDETFCRHGTCQGRKCKNEQCIERHQWCDSVPHCADRSDETTCGSSTITLHPARLPPPAIVNFLDIGDFTQTPMNTSQPCPDTHFRCEGDYCFPVYLRCNGVYDCLTHQDEAGCDSYTCPGMYRCRASLVCVHVAHLCDSVFQCPQGDDELLCQLDCPPGCMCQGLAFVCHVPFTARALPELRYLDASGSGITIDSLKDAFHLVWLRVSSCGLKSVNDMTFPNVQFLDLSENQMTSISVDAFLHLENLRALSLAGNPLVKLLKGTSLRVQNQLEKLDISHAQLETYDCTVLENFVSMKFLNISFSNVNNIGQRRFDLLPSLTRIDIRGNPVRHFPKHLFRELSFLRIIHASNYRLCCRDNLPYQFEENFCFTPEDEISSCDDLLRSDLYRSSLWLMSSLSVVGNIGSFGFRLLVEGTASKSSFNVFVTSLSFADFLMGVYLAIVGVADITYRGNYLWYEYSWTEGRACKVAGFLSLLSSEVSAFMICLITLDRFIVLRFPFATIRFSRWSAAVCSSLAWISGLILAALPLVPMTSHWEFYSQTGICIPLPITRRDFEGRDYSFGVMIVFNFVLFLLIAGGQATIYRSVQGNILTTDTTKRSQDLTIARRLLTVVVSNFLCWFPVGLLGLLASGGVPISGEVTVAIAIFVLPLNSALNPFLYTLNMLTERRRKRQEMRLMKVLESRLASQKTDLTSSKTCVSSDNLQASVSTEQEALDFLKKCLWSGVAVSDEIVSVLEQLRTKTPDSNSK